MESDEMMQHARLDEQREPNAIGYATSEDGLTWIKHQNNPIFRPDPKNEWEQDRVTGCHVIRRGHWVFMFYIGFQDGNHSQIGLAPLTFTFADGTDRRAIPTGIQLQSGRGLQSVLLEPGSGQSQAVAADDLVNVQ